jgi:hypothetical protein
MGSGWSDRVNDEERSIKRTGVKPKPAVVCDYCKRNDHHLCWRGVTFLLPSQCMCPQRH